MECKSIFGGRKPELDLENGLGHEPLSQCEINTIIEALEDWDQNWEGNLKPKKTEDILESWV